MLNRDSESTWEDENVLEMDDGVGSTTMWMYLMPYNDTPKNSELYVHVIYILLQKNFIDLRHRSVTICYSRNRKLTYTVTISPLLPFKFFHGVLLEKSSALSVWEICGQIYLAQQASSDMEALNYRDHRKPFQQWQRYQVLVSPMCLGIRAQ
jgi:hypothetical protein